MATGGRRFLALVGALALLAGATGALAAQPLIPHDPIKSKWRKVADSADGQAAFYIPADKLEAVRDGITRAVTLTVKLDRRGRPTGYTVMNMSIGCRTPRFAIANMDLYDAAGRLTQSSRGTKDNIVVEPITEDSVVKAVADIVCGGPVEGRPRNPPARKAQLSSGTGWLSERGYIVTASHVITGADHIRLYQEGRPIGEAVVVANDPSNDVAVLKPSFDVSPYVGLRLRGRPAGLGTRIFTLGYPLADTLGVRSVKLATGDITGLTGLGDDNRPDDPRFAQISLPVQSGNSGGPVIDDLGTVAGMVVAKSNFTEEAEIIQNLNFAIKSSYIAPLLDELPRIGGARPVDAADSNRVEAVKSSIFMILVEGSES